MAGRIRPGVADAANGVAVYLNHSGKAVGVALLRRLRVERPAAPDPLGSASLIEWTELPGKVRHP